MKDSLSDDERAPVIDGSSGCTSINNVLRLHLFSCFGSLVFVDPIWLVPVVVGNDTKFHLGVGHHADTPEKGDTRGALVKFMGKMWRGKRAS